MPGPDGVWSAPGRVNLVGEHTDYNGGLCLPFAIDARTRVAARRRPDDRVQLRSVQQPGQDVDTTVAAVAAGELPGWSAYAAGVLTVLLRRGHLLGGIELQVDSALAAGAGLSSSAALECAVALAVNDLFGLQLPRRALADLAQNAENTVVGVPCGPMDQRVAMLARAGCALLVDTGADTDEALPFAPAAAGLAVLVVDTQVRHALADGEYADRRRRCELAAARLQVPTLSQLRLGDLAAAEQQLADPPLAAAVRHVVTENARVCDAAALLRAGDLPAVGPLLTASHASLRDDYAVSCAELDVAVATLLSAGAVGARMTGGGFGGCAIALLPTDTVEVAVATVASAFTGRGWPPPRCRIVTASAGACREG